MLLEEKILCTKLKIPQFLIHGDLEPKTKQCSLVLDSMTAHVCSETRLQWGLQMWQGQHCQGHWMCYAPDFEFILSSSSDTFSYCQNITQTTPPLQAHMRLWLSLRSCDLPSCHFAGIVISYCITQHTKCNNHYYIVLMNFLFKVEVTQIDFFLFLFFPPSVSVLFLCLFFAGRGSHYIVLASLVDWTL